VSCCVEFGYSTCVHLSLLMHILHYMGSCIPELNMTSIRNVQGAQPHNIYEHQISYKTRASEIRQYGRQSVTASAFQFAIRIDSIHLTNRFESIRFPKKSDRSIRPQLGVCMQYLTTLYVFSMPDTLNISFIRHFIPYYKSTAATVELKRFESIRIDWNRFSGVNRIESKLFLANWNALVTAARRGFSAPWADCNFAAPKK